MYQHLEKKKKREKKTEKVQQRMRENKLNRQLYKEITAWTKDELQDEGQKTLPRANQFYVCIFCRSLLSIFSRLHDFDLKAKEICKRVISSTCISQTAFSSPLCIPLKVAAPNDEI